MDSLIGKLRAIYSKLGCLGNANPVSHSLVKEYLNLQGKSKPVWH